MTAAPAPAPAFDPLLILVAEDQPGIADLLESIILNRGHQAMVAHDGEEAWELYREHGAEVVFTDWMMPKCDGMELVRRIRAQPYEHVDYTWICFTSILDDRQSVLQALDAGADDYVGKPYLPDDILARIMIAERITRVHRERDRYLHQVEKLNTELAELLALHREAGGARPGE